MGKPAATKAAAPGTAAKGGGQALRSDTTDSLITTLIDSILAEIDAEIARLERAKALLTTEAPMKRGPGRPKGTAAQSAPKKSRLSAEARERIRQGQVKRWVAQKKKTK